jgi:peroxiredoxin
MNQEHIRAEPILKQVLFILGGVITITAAFILIVNTGLPERANFTGQIIPGERPIAPEIDATAPPFELLTLSGSTVNLLDLRGQPVVINFWATWCGPCEAEMQVLQTLYDDYREQGLRVVAVNLGESAQVIDDWVQRLQLTFDIVLDEQQYVAALYQLRGTPSTYIVAPSGIITDIHYGPTSRDALQAALNPYISGDR